MSEELKPVAWRYRYDAPGRKVHWTLTQRPMASQPARPGWCAVIAEPLYLHPPAAAPSPHVGGGEDSSASGSVQAEPGLPAANHDASLPAAEAVSRDMAGETVCGFRVAAWRETHLEHGDRFGHRYSEHWSTPSRNPAVTVERLFTEAQLRDLLNIAALARELVSPAGMVNRGVDRGLVVVEKPDKSDPHYRLCKALEALPTPTTQEAGHAE